MPGLSRIADGWWFYEVGSAIFASQQVKVDEDDEDEDDDMRPSPTPAPGRAPRQPGEFALRYDDESMVSKLDIGGEDQAVKYVL